MTGEVMALDPVQVLGLPERARLAERITKRMLRDQIGGAERAADGRLVDRAVASVRVVGILRPETIAVPAYRVGSGPDVTDIAVLHMRLNPRTAPAQQRRLVELVQRAMPRLVILFVEGPDQPAEVALALTHVSRTDPGQRTSVIDGAVTVPVIGLAAGALDIARCDRTDLWSLYRDLVRSAASGGRPASAALSAEEAVRLHHQLVALLAELDATAREARRARSQQTRITLNTAARALRQQIDTVRGDLYGGDPSSAEPPQPDPGETTT